VSLAKTIDSSDPTEELNRAIWGDVEPSRHPYVRSVIHIIPDLRMAARDITLIVFADENWTRDIHGHRYFLERNQFVGKASIDHRDMVGRREVRLFADRLRALIREMSAAMYEYDPRIGHCLKDFNDRLPRCPLFEPPLWPNPAWGDPERDWMVNVPNETPCPLCGEKFHADDPPMWGGGNVCWVHKGCWAKGLPRMQWGPERVRLA
jgi:hypothetical protein